MIIGNEAVDYPFVTHPDVLCTLFQEAYERFRPQLKPGGILIIEADLVTPHADDDGAIRLPATQISAELGSKLAANMVVLGYLVAATGVVGRTSMEDAIRATVAPQHLDLDLRALDAGFERAERDK